MSHCRPRQRTRRVANAVHVNCCHVACCQLAAVGHHIPQVMRVHAGTRHPCMAGAWCCMFFFFIFVPFFLLLRSKQNIFHGNDTVRK